MLNPNLLRKKTKEAEERIERERQLEEEKLRRLEELKKLEAERQRQLEEERARLKKLTLKYTTEILREAIKSAAQGARSVQVEVPLEIHSRVINQITHAGMKCKSSQLSEWDLTLQARVSKLVEKLGADPAAEKYKEQLLAAASLEEPDQNEIHHLIEDIQDDLDYSLPSTAITYINLNLKPHLSADTAEFESEILETTWKPKDPIDHLLKDLHQVPSWLLSNGGSGLMQRIGECLSLAAEEGHTEATFNLTPLPENMDRWGQNSMTKFVFKIQPVGVCPFTPEVFCESIKALGFKAELRLQQNSRNLIIRW